MNVGTYIVFKAFDEPYMQSDLCKQDWAKMIKRKPTELIKIIEQIDKNANKVFVEQNTLINTLTEQNERLKNALKAINETISNYEQTNH